jgi:DNA-binding LytR/AlgR family response regulator
MRKFFFIKSERRYIKLNFDDILYIEGCKNYIKIVTEKKTYLILFSMKAIENFLPVHLFRRIHKSFIVSLDKVVAFDSSYVYLTDKKLPVGVLYKGELEKYILIANERDVEIESDKLPFYSIHSISNTRKRK